MKSFFMVMTLKTRNASGIGAENGVSVAGMFFIVYDNWFSEVLL